MFITKKTKLKIKLNSILMLCLLVITAALLARLTYKNSVEYDWTVSGRHTLSDASLKILSKMPEKIEVISYARETPFLRQSIKKFIGKYQRHKPNLVLSFVNPDTAPDEARNLGITVDGEIKLSCRPSDAIALALRTSSKISVDYDLFINNSIEIYDEKSVDLEEFIDFIDNVNPNDFS